MWVEVDETYVGGRDEGKIRPPQKESQKSIVAVAVELLEPKGFIRVRVRLRRIAAASQENVLPFIREVIKPGTVIHTDGSEAYRSLHEYGYSRHNIVHLCSPDPTQVTMPGVHRIASLLKR